MKYTVDKAMKVPIFKLLWALYDDLLEERSNSSARDNTGTIIGWYAGIIEKRIQENTDDRYFQRKNDDEVADAYKDES